MLRNKGTTYVKYWEIAQNLYLKYISSFITFVIYLTLKNDEFISIIKLREVWFMKKFLFKSIYLPVLTIDGNW